MKSLYLLFGCLILQQIIVAQLPPWNLEFYVYHPDGHTDTLWVGCDENATAGYDEGLDIIDTTFNTPIAIRGFSQEVEDAFNFNTCVNLKKDIRPFGYPTEFTFYILHDDIGSFDSVYLGWDTSMLNYEVGDYLIQSVYMYSDYGYIEGIDGTLLSILGRYPDTSVFIYSVDKVPIFALGEDIPCFNNESNEYIIKLTLFAGFKDYAVFIGDNISSSKYISIYPNPSTNSLQIHSNLIQPVKAYISNLLGETIDTITIKPGEQELNISQLPAGAYIIKVSSHYSNQSFTLQFIKL